MTWFYFNLKAFLVCLPASTMGAKRAFVVGYRILMAVFIACVVLFVLFLHPEHNTWCCMGDFGTHFSRLKYGMCDDDRAPINNKFKYLRQDCKVLSTGGIATVSIFSGSAFLCILAYLYFVNKSQKDLLFLRSDERGYSSKIKK